MSTIKLTLDLHSSQFSFFFLFFGFITVKWKHDMHKPLSTLRREAFFSFEGTSHSIHQTSRVGACKGRMKWEKCCAENRFVFKLNNFFWSLRNLLPFIHLTVAFSERNQTERENHQKKLAVNYQTTECNIWQHKCHICIIYWLFNLQIYVAFFPATPLVWESEHMFGMLHRSKLWCSRAVYFWLPPSLQGMLLRID